MSPQSFKVLKIGGGGFMTGLDLHPDGTKMCRSDVYGCWMWNAGTGVWDSLLTPARGFNLPITGVWHGQWAAYDMQAAPSNSSIIYIYLNDGNLYRSLDHGASFVQLTNFTNAPCGTNNGPTRFNGRRVAIDPINPDVVYIGTPGNGVFVTSNGSQGTAATPTFSAVAGIATAGKPSGYNLAFDPNSGATSGKTNVMCIFSNGTGMYKATAPLGSFTLTTGGPTSCSRLVCSQLNATGSSIFYVANDTTTIYKFASGAWSTLSPGISAHSITVDPSNNARLVAGSDGGQVSVSTNTGGAWTPLAYPNAIISPDIPWQALTNEGYKSNGDILFDPSQSNYVMFAEGIGILNASSFPNSGSLSWTSQSKGIENIIPNAICASPNTAGTPTVSVWDRFAFYSANQDAYPSTQAPNNLISISMAWDLDYATSDGTTILAAPGYFGIPQIDSTAISSDNGQTWKFMPPSAYGARTVTTSGASSIGTNTLTIATQPFTLAIQMLVSDVTNSAAIPAGTYITAISGSTVTLSQNIVAPGVSSGDTINVKFASTPNLAFMQTSAPSTASPTLTFGVAVPAQITVGMAAFPYPSTNPFGFVKSVSGSTITLDSNVTVAPGDIIAFAWGHGGCCAMSSPSNFMMAGSNDPGWPYVTADGGSTWTPIDLPLTPRPGLGDLVSGSPIVSNTTFNTNTLRVGQILADSTNALIPPFAQTTVLSITNSNTFVMSQNALGTKVGAVIIPESGWSHANYYNLKIMAADRVTANKFYLYNYITGSVYVSTASGANGTWSVANSAANSSNHTNLVTDFGMGLGFEMALKAVPMLGSVNTAGHLFMAEGNAAFGNGASFIRSIDGGVNWNAVANVTSVNAFGFGKPLPGGGGYPTIFIYGKVSGVLGLYRSDDNCASWVPLGTDKPLGSQDVVNELDGDKNIYGRFYGGFSANGFFYYG